MSDSDKFYGTGDKIGEIGDVEIYDDGHHDYDVQFHLPEGSKSRSFSSLRSALGDDVLEEALQGISEEGTVSSTDFEQREAVAFKCQQCNQTYPRTMKAREGVCTDCS